jgi:hypothetical protein
MVSRMSLRPGLRAHEVLVAQKMFCEEVSVELQVSTEATQFAQGLVQGHSAISKGAESWPGYSRDAVLKRRALNEHCVFDT